MAAFPPTRFRQALPPLRSLTHVTEWGLAICAGVLDLRWTVGEAARLGALGIREDTVACDESEVTDGRFINGGEGDVVLTIRTRTVIPTCPRCAVLRDEALERGGRWCTIPRRYFSC
jgi:hypothetical protein